jgi:hypothetical protein
MPNDDTVNAEEPEVLGRIAGLLMTAQDQIAQQMDVKYGPQNHDINLRPQKLCSYDHLHVYLEGEFPDKELLTNIDCSDSLEVLFLTKQMPLKRGLKAFGKLALMQ